MKKLFKPFSVLAAVALMASCSNDEPVPGNGGVDNGGSIDAYLSVNINDAGTMIGRATADGGTLKDNIDNAENFDYLYGVENENIVDNVKFYFYTADKMFSQEATLLEFNGNKGDNDNVEVISKNVLVLKGLTNNTTPTYMLTVINPPKGFEPGRTLDETRDALVDVIHDTEKEVAAGEDKTRFVMTTTSFDGTHEIGVNTLTTSNFFIQPAGTEVPDNVLDNIVSGSDDDKKIVNVYVERLAAKVQVKYAKADLNKGYVKLDISVAGNPNNVGQDDAALSEVYVKLSNWTLNAVAPQSYMTKKISGSDFETFTNWNDPGYFRSYWGMGALWGKKLDETNAIFNGYADATNQFNVSTSYCAENTNLVANIASGNQTLNRNLTHVLFTATVFEKATGNETGEEAELVNADGYKPLNMVRYNGVLYRTEWFYDFVLNHLNANGDLEYYYKNGEDYVQFDAKKLGLHLEATNNGTGMVQVVSGLKEGDKYYVVEEQADGTKKAIEYTFDVAALNNKLAKFDSYKNAESAVAKVNAYTGGAMYYAIPIEHLIKRADATQDIVAGNYGVVRNHWYEITINNIFKLGTGVFTPGKDGETILPPDTPEDPTYYLGARINILSWKIVKQVVNV